LARSSQDLGEGAGSQTTTIRSAPASAYVASWVAKWAGVPAIATSRARSAGTPYMEFSIPAVTSARSGPEPVPIAACRPMPVSGLARPASSESSNSRRRLAANSRGVCSPDSQPSPNPTARRHHARRRRSA